MCQAMRCPRASNIDFAGVTARHGAFARLSTLGGCCSAECTVSIWSIYTYIVYFQTMRTRLYLQLYCCNMASVRVRVRRWCGDGDEMECLCILYTWLPKTMHYEFRLGVQRLTFFANAFIGFHKQQQQQQTTPVHFVAESMHRSTDSASVRQCGQLRNECTFRTQLNIICTLRSNADN